MAPRSGVGGSGEQEEAQRAWGPQIRNGPTLPGWGDAGGRRKQDGLRWEEAVRAAGVHPRGARASRPGASAEFGKLGGSKAGRRAERRSRAGVGVMLGTSGGPGRPSP